MVKEKNLDAGKQTDKPQEKFSNELMNDEELDQVASGAGGVGGWKVFDGAEIAEIAKMLNTSESESGVGGWKVFDGAEIVKMLNTSESESGVGGWKGFVTKENSTSDFRVDEFHCK